MEVDKETGERIHADATTSENLPRNLACPPSMKVISRTHERAELPGFDTPGLFPESSNPAADDRLFFQPTSGADELFMSDN